MCLMHNSGWMPSRVVVEVPLYEMMMMMLGGERQQQTRPSRIIHRTGTASASAPGDRRR